MTLEAQPEAERIYAEKYARFLACLQANAEQTTDVFLMFSPLAKNAVMLAVALRQNARVGKALRIVPGAYRDAHNMIRRYNKKEGTNHTALPWPLQRFEGHDTRPDPWNIWFEDFRPADAGGSRANGKDLEQLDAELARLRPLVERPDLVELAICFAHVTQLNQAFAERIKGDLVAPVTGCVAVHIRRGDAGTPGKTVLDPKRMHFELGSYIEEMERYLKKGYSSFYVLSESIEEILALKEHFSGRCEVYYCKTIERAQFIEPEEDANDWKNYVEFRCLEDPVFAEFMTRTAVIDLANAARCEGFIGTLESAFSAAAMLGCMGNSRRRLPYTDLTGVGLTKVIFLPNVMWQKTEDLFFIKERDVGFFSMYLQVVNSLILVDQSTRGLVPISDFGPNQIYFTGTDTFEEVFEPLSIYSEHIHGKQRERARKSFEHFKRHMFRWTGFGTIFRIGKRVIWSASYYPRHEINHTMAKVAFVHFSKLKRWLTPKTETITFARVPTKDERSYASKLIGKYISLKPKFRKPVRELMEPYENHYKIGVQFRGTDARTDERRKIPEYDEYPAAIEAHLQSIPAARRKQVVIFAASDEQDFIDFLKQRFEDVISFNSLRHIDGNLRTDGPTGWLMPDFITGDKEAALAGAVLDFAGLCACDHMVHSFGSLTNAVLMNNPEMTNQLIGQEYVG